MIGKKTVVILGGWGFLGQHVVAQFLAQGYEVHISERDSGPRRGRPRQEPLVAHFPLRELGTLLASTKVEAVIFAITNYGRAGEEAKLLLEANIGVLVDALEAVARALQRPKFIYIGSIVSETHSFYGACKKAAHCFLRHYASRGLDIAHAIVHNIYGPNDETGSFLADSLKKICNAETVRCSDGLQSRDFIYVKDVARALHVIATSDVKGYKELEVGTGTAITIRTYLQTIRELSGKAQAQILFGTLPNRTSEEDERKADLTAMAEIGWSPEWSLAAGLNEILSSQKISV